MLTLSLLFLLAVVDYLSGFEISLSVFYVLPVGLAAWTLGRRPGVIVSILSGLALTESDLLASDRALRHWIPIWNTSMRIVFFIIIAVLIAEIRVLLDDERTLARTDSLTGLLNRRAFFTAADTALRRRPVFSTLYIDLDGFKDVNDRLGHRTGDMVLQSVASTIAFNTRASDLPTRIGGDEFAVLLPNTDEAGATVIAEKLRSELLNEMRTHAWPVTFSIGVLFCDDHESTLEDVLDRADRVMYLAKNAGKDAIAIERLSAERGVPV